MVSPAARGLFHRAAVQSGAGSTGSRTLAALEAAGVRRAREWGAASLAGMRKLPARDIVAKPAPGGLTAYSPAVDGVLLTDSVASAFSRGTQAPAPLLIGANSWEGSLISGSPTGGVLDKMAGALREKVEAVYGTEWPKAVQALYGDFVFVMPARRFAGQMEKVNRPAYLYHFSFVPTPLREKTPGARHGAEIRYVFNNVTAGLGTALAGEEERGLGELMSAYWAEFARTGNPNGGDRPAWPAYTRATDRLLEFSGPRPAVRERFRAAQLDFVESLLNNPALER
jgi:para-nitrobenzyl esterase